MFLLTSILPLKPITKDEQDTYEIIRTFDTENPGDSESDFILLETRLLYELVGTLCGRIMFDATVDTLVNRMTLNPDIYTFVLNEQLAPLLFLLAAGHMTTIPFFFENIFSGPDSIFRVSW